MTSAAALQTEPTGSRRTDIRNVAIIAHVDHGKTTLVDCLLRQSGQYRASQLAGERILDSGDLERERGITILAKNIALDWKGTKINLIDTPGHADFGGEVERVLRMADGALVLVDAAEGPMPQTRFVLGKALECRLRPVVVVNKIDRPDARPLEVLDEILELFLELGADDDLADFPYVYASSREGFASHDHAVREGTMEPLLDLVLEKIPGPVVDAAAPLRMLVTTLDWSDYVGRIAIGRVESGLLEKGAAVVRSTSSEGLLSARAVGVQVFDKLGRVDAERATAGDIAAVSGIEDVEIGDTICDPGDPRPLPRLSVDEPTLSMVFGINSSPLAGKSGKYLTTRHLRDRLAKELERNVALRVEPIPGTEQFAVSGRGLLHLSVLIETMRREGFEISVGKPRVILRKEAGVTLEPFETLVVEVPHDKFGPVMELVGARRGQLAHMGNRGEFAHAVFSIPARGLIGLRTRVLNATQGTAIIHHRFEKWSPLEGEVAGRANGVLVSMVSGKAVAFGLDGLQERADLFIAPGDEVYEGMIVGENARGDDMTVNPTKEKKLTNMRASGSDRNILLKPPRQMSLEEALEYIEDDELVEVTPAVIRLRKILLSEHERRKQARAKS
ncbi:MAG: translational GTPase TypA [Planctomycetota bacterium]|jgi:GTP-binding protein|nr:translational GTPase TypA [Planctomycetota bacterium]MDA1200754.1 translational GTPase TypA [Planctomycetota bacterium]